MKNFKNFRRNKYRNNVRSFKSNSGAKFNGEYNVSGEFKRKKISKNINLAKLVEKYTELAKEALSNGDKILSENYFQHADHFMRISEKQNSTNTEKNVESYPDTPDSNLNEKKLI